MWQTCVKSWKVSVLVGFQKGRWGVFRCVAATSSFCAMLFCCLAGLPVGFVATWQACWLQDVANMHKSWKAIPLQIKSLPRTPRFYRYKLGCTPRNLYRIHKPNQNDPLQDLRVWGIDLTPHFCGVPLERIRTAIFWHVSRGYLHICQIWLMDSTEGAGAYPSWEKQKERKTANEEKQKERKRQNNKISKTNHNILYEWEVIISLWLQLYQQNLFWIRVQCGLIRMWMCLLRIWLFFLFFTFFCHMIKWCFLSTT